MILATCAGTFLAVAIVGSIHMHQATKKANDLAQLRNDRAEAIALSNESVRIAVNIPHNQQNADANRIESDKMLAKFLVDEKTAESDGLDEANILAAIKANVVARVSIAECDRKYSDWHNKYDQSIPELTSEASQTELNRMVSIGCGPEINKQNEIMLRKDGLLDKDGYMKVGK
jgi:hypothetical protein